MRKWHTDNGKKNATPPLVKGRKIWKFKSLILSFTLNFVLIFSCNCLLPLFRQLVIFKSVIFVSFFFKIKLLTTRWRDYNGQFQKLFEISLFLVIFPLTRRCVKPFWVMCDSFYEI